jgi:hypothetical protein
MCKRIKTEFNGFLEPNGESDKFVIGEGEKKAKQINFTFLFVTLYQMKVRGEIMNKRGEIALKLNCYLSAIL